MWDSLSSDVLGIIFEGLETTSSLAAVASTNHHWRMAVHRAKSPWRVCAFRASYNMEIRRIESFLHFIERAPRGTIEDLMFEVDVPSCPNQDLEDLGSRIIDRLRAILDLHKESLRRVSLKFILCPLVPSVLRSLVIRPHQSSFFKLARTLESLRGLRVLQLQGALMPVFIGPSVDLHITSTVADLYPDASKLAPSAFISKLIYSSTRKLMRGHMIFKIRTKHPEGDFGHHVISDYVYDNVLPFEYTNVGNTCNIKLNHHTTTPPGMVIFILCMRAINYIIFDKKVHHMYPNLRWKQVFKNSQDAVNLGFLCERLPC
jgi:hypothetical protein